MTAKKDKKEKPSKSGEVELTEQDLKKVTGGRKAVTKVDPT